MSDLLLIFCCSGAPEEALLFELLVLQLPRKMFLAVRIDVIMRIMSKKELSAE